MTSPVLPGEGPMTDEELPLGHEFQPPAGISMMDPAYDECAHRADALGTLCGAPEGAHDAATAWAYDPNVISWDWKAQPDLNELARLLEPLGVTLTQIETGGDEYAVRVEPSSGMPHTPAQEARGDAGTSETGSGRGTGEREAQKPAQEDDTWFSDVAASVKPLHYREAATDLRTLADDPAWAWGPIHHEGMIHAADHLDARARDLASLPVKEGP